LCASDSDPSACCVAHDQNRTLPVPSKKPEAEQPLQTDIICSVTCATKSNRRRSDADTRGRRVRHHKLDICSAVYKRGIGSRSASGHLDPREADTHVASDLLHLSRIMADENASQQAFIQALLQWDYEAMFDKYESGAGVVDDLPTIGTTFSSIEVGSTAAS
jgi:hypothetical protein